MKDETCPVCNSANITRKHMFAAGDAYECLKCGKMWGWYYDRNRTENRNKPNPS